MTNAHSSDETPLVLDTGPLRKIAHRKRTPENNAKYRALMAWGAVVYLPGRGIVPQSELGRSE